MMNETALSKTPSVLGNWALLLAQVIDSYEVNSELIFFNAGIDLRALKNPISRVPAEPMPRIWQQAVTQSQDPYISLRMAKLCQPSTFGAWGMRLAVSRHIYEALQHGAQYSHFISDAIQCRIEENYSVVAYRINTHEPLKSANSTPAIEAGITCLFNLLQALKNGPLAAKAVHFQHSFSGSVTPYEDFFGCRVYFSSYCNKLEFHKKDILQEQPFSDPQLASSLGEWVEQHIASLNVNSATTCVQEYIMQDLVYGEVDLLTVAKKMSLSPRLLQRKLKDEGTCYSHMLNNCRLKLAKKLIDHNQRPLSEVAKTLGFSEHSNFTRWFKRSTGTTPRNFRHNIIEGQISRNVTLSAVAVQSS